MSNFSYVPKFRRVLSCHSCLRYSNFNQPTQILTSFYDQTDLVLIHSILLSSTLVSLFFSYLPYPQNMVPFGNLLKPVF